MSIPYALGIAQETVVKSLHTFTKSLLDHRANDVKTTKDAVNAHYDAWLQAVREKEEDLNVLQQHYEEKHSVPRRESRMAYDAFKQQQMVARTTFQESKNRRDLNTWVESRFEERHHAGVLDEVYTKYVYDV
jgi:hypothetical protein